MINRILKLTQANDQPVPRDVVNEDTGSAAAKHTLPIGQLEKEAHHRELYVKRIKDFINSDGSVKPPRRLEPNLT